MTLLKFYRNYWAKKLKNPRFAQIKNPFGDYVAELGDMNYTPINNSCECGETYYFAIDDNNQVWVIYPSECRDNIQGNAHIVNNTDIYGNYACR